MGDRINQATVIPDDNNDECKYTKVLIFCKASSNLEPEFLILLFFSCPINFYPLHAKQIKKYIKLLECA